jgi:aspartate 1-decarboxylase
MLTNKLLAMNLNMLKAKIHTVRVTEANIKYHGSITIDADLLDAAGIKKYEQVYINNASNGSRIMTYVLPGKRGSGEVCMNGGAALHAKVGDTVHILCFCSVDDKDLDQHIPLVIFTDENNKVRSIEEYK